MSAITWTCHVCREERPDSAISVLKTIGSVRGIEFQQNVRYCNDRSECIRGAADVQFVKPDSERAS